MNYYIVSTLNIEKVLSSQDLWFPLKNALSIIERPIDNFRDDNKYKG